MSFAFSIPSSGNISDFSLDTGGSLIFVGANGGGKTRLAVHIENTLGELAHRISAHRALSLNAEVAKISEAQAKRGLKYGYAGPTSQLHHRSPNRWGDKQATQLLNDFDFLIQVLFAEQSNTSLKAYDRFKLGGTAGNEAVELTKFDRLKDIWSRLLPHRELHISGDDITVLVPGTDSSYKASDMSDGERAIFYMIGQVLAAEQNQALIIDEPELHVHRSIMSKLWDELEAVRADCGFIFITHDLEFAAARSAKKYVVRDYTSAPTWDVNTVPEETGFDEELTTLILGSRKPVLFVEGDHSSLDFALYRCCYPDFTIIPRSSCTEVIHSVATLRANKQLTRVQCSGIVDCDHYSEEDKDYLDRLGIKTLPVAEIENLFVHPSVSRTIAVSEGHEGDALEKLLDDLASEVFARVNSEEKLENIVMRYAKRRIDRLLKRIDLSEAETVDDLAAEYTTRTGELNVKEIAVTLRDEIERALRARDLVKLLALVDDKGFLAIAATRLKACRLNDFKSWLTRTLRNQSAPEMVSAVRGLLPEIAVDTI